MRLLIVLLLVALGGVCTSGTAAAQAADPVPDILDAYQGVDYERAERLARAALADFDELQPGQLVEIHKVLAFISFSQGYRTEAERHFVSALTLNPDLTLDPSLVSPLIIEFFDEVKATADVETASPEAAVRYVVVQDVRAAAALRSLIVPGWGQLYKGQRGRGAAFLAVWAAAAAGTGASHLQYLDAQDRYESATEPGAVQEAYRDYNQWYQVRNNLLMGTAIVWAAAYVEALVSPGGRRNDLRLTPSVHGAALKVRF